MDSLGSMETESFGLEILTTVLQVEAGMRRSRTNAGKAEPLGWETEQRGKGWA